MMIKNKIKIKIDLRFLKNLSNQKILDEIQESGIDVK